MLKRLSRILRGTRTADVSILIPAYAAEAFIDRTLHFARGQTFSNCRILVSVDAAGDQTALLELASTLEERGLQDLADEVQKMADAKGELAKLTEGLDEEAAAKKLKKRKSRRRKDAKELARQKAASLFPGLNLLRTPRCKKPDDNLCEALLLAEMARRLYGG